MNKISHEAIYKCFEKLNFFYNFVKNKVLWAKPKK